MFRKRPTGVENELRVEPEDFEGEGHLVDHALAGTVTVGKQFKVPDAIVVSIPVLVVDRLPIEKIATDMLFHDVPVLENLLTPKSYGVSNHHRDIAPFISARDVAVSESPIKRSRLMQRLAFPVAKLLFVVKSATWPPPSRIDLPALQAGKRIPGVSVRASPDIGAWHRTIERVATPLLSQRRNYAGLHRKWVAALFAGKLSKRYPGSDTPMQTLMLGLARPFAELPLTVLWFDRKRAAAIFARQLNRHGFVPSFDKTDFAMPGRYSQ